MEKSDLRNIPLIIILISVIVFVFYLNFPTKSNALTVINEEIYVDESDSNKNWKTLSYKFNWLKGSGFWYDPYVIEGIIFDGIGSSFCLSIKNSDKYFIVRNCEFIDAEIGIQLRFSKNGEIIANKMEVTGIGLSLYTCRDIFVLENMLSNSVDKGLFVASCVNLIIQENIISKNYHGIYAQKCHDNEYTENKLIHNTLNGYFAEHCYGEIIKDNSIGFNHLAGLSLFDCDNLEIKRNIIQGNGEEGMILDTCGALNVVYNEISKKNHGGILDLDGKNNLFHQNVINNNYLFGFTGYSGQGGIISNNYIMDNEEIGIELSDTVNIEISLNNISNHTFGVSLIHSENITGYNNSLSNNQCCLYTEECSKISFDEAQCRDQLINEFKSIFTIAGYKFAYLLISSTIVIIIVAIRLKQNR